MRIGIVGARLDHAGLGVQALGFASHIPCERILALEVGGRVQDATMYDGVCADVRIATHPWCLEREIVREFMLGLDVAVGFETFYANHTVVEMGLRTGCRTVLQVNYEWLDSAWPSPSLYIAPSRWHYDDIPDPKVFLPVPVDTERIKFRERTAARVFLFNGGNMDAAWDRNGWNILREAIPLVKSDVRFVVKSQQPVRAIDDKRVTYICEDAVDYAAIYDVADVLLFPRRYGGLSLPFQEAMAAGLPVIASRMFPQDGLIGSDWLVDTRTEESQRVHQTFAYGTTSPEAWAAKIDAVAGTDVRAQSRAMRGVAEGLSWGAWRGQYMAAFEGLL